jgi:pimeloyl-ACP methyl ester carboxylesterase
MFSPRTRPSFSASSAAAFLSSYRACLFRANTRGRGPIRCCFSFFHSGGPWKLCYHHQFQQQQQQQDRKVSWAHQAPTSSSSPANLLRPPPPFVGVSRCDLSTTTTSTNHPPPHLASSTTNDPMVLHAEWVAVPTLPPNKVTITPTTSSASSGPGSGDASPAATTTAAAADSSSSAAANTTTTGGVAAVFLHGLLGSGRNLKTLAQRYCRQQQQQPQPQHPTATTTRGLLVDLRGHGKSFLHLGGGSDDASDDKVEEAEASVALFAQDLRRTLQHHLGSEDGNKGGAPNRTRADHLQLVGHSLGGRVALQYCYDRHCIQGGSATATTTTNDYDDGNDPRMLPPVSRLWLLDTVPGLPNDGVVRVVNQVEQFLKDDNDNDDNVDEYLPQHREQQQQQVEQGSSPHPRRRHGRTHQDIASILHDTYGIDRGTAAWLASSYRPASPGIRSSSFAFSVPIAQALLRNFAQQNFWEQLEGVLREADDRREPSSSTTSLRVDLVMAGKNPLWSPHVTDRLYALQDRHPESLKLHVLPKAGHWVHVDDLQGLLELMKE